MLRRAKLILGLTAVAAVGLTTSCGSDAERAAPAAPQRLTAAERAAAQAGHDAIRSYCRRLGLHLAGRRAAPSAEIRRRAADAARRIASLSRRKPAARYAGGRTVRELAGDIAEDLEGTNCSTRLVVELERGL